jgi:hypothetical protein
MTKRTIKDVGLTPDQIEYLVGRSQEINPPSDFDDEVQRYLDEWTARESKNSSFYKYLSKEDLRNFVCRWDPRGASYFAAHSLPTLNEPKRWSPLLTGRVFCG